MSDFHRLMINNIDGDNRWSQIIKNFDNYWIKYPNKCDIINIPKIFHQIWLGGKIPDKYNKLMQSFRDKNPDWEFRLWTDEDAKSFDMINRDVFDKIQNLGAKSDIFRYEILYKYGGVYTDTDFICLKSFNDFLHLDLFSGTGHVGHPEAFNGLIGTKPNNKLVMKLIEKIKSIPENRINNYDITNITGPMVFSSIFFDYLHSNLDDKIILFPTQFFYSFPAIKRFEIRENLNEEVIFKFKSEESYCVHLWYTSWQK